ncbi:MAG: hypothetical protein ABSC95_18050 [Acetobacteraceae bacterium]|jgi:hypothetical protein
MSRKPAALPHIEDATFAACLAPLAEALMSHADAEIRSHTADRAPTEPQPVPAGSADRGYPGPVHRLRNAGAAGDAGIAPGSAGVSPTPQALAEWRLVADQEFATFCTIELFLAKSDAELSAAVLAYPRQIVGFLERIARMEHRRALQHQAMIELMTRIQMAMMEAENESGRDLRPPATARGDVPFINRRKE